MSNPNQPFPEASVTEISPGAAFAATGIPDVAVIAGPALRGPFTPKLIGASDLATLVATFGCGAAVKVAAYAMARVAQAIVFLRMVQATALTFLSAVTVTRTVSGSVPTNTIAGTALDGADVLITYTLGGVTGTGPITYTVSLDGGATTGSPISLGTATSIVVLGVTLTLGSSKTITAADTTAWYQIPPSSTVLPTTFTGTGTSVITVTGSPSPDAYEVAFRCIVGGTIGAASTITYQYALDYKAASPTWSPVASIGAATTLLLLDGPISLESTGLTLNFAAGTLVAGDLFVFAVSAPQYDSAGLTAATNALTASGAPGWTWPYFVGPVREALAGSADAIVTAWDSGAKPSWGIVDARDRAGTETLAVWSARVDAEFGPYTSTHMAVSKGMARGLCPITGRSNRRPWGMFVLARAMGADGATIATDWAEFDLGPLSADVSITDINLVQVEYDSRTDPNGVTMGFLAARTWLGEPGIYPARASLLGPDGNLKLIPIRRVFNVMKILEKQILQLQVCKNFRQWKAGSTPKKFAVGDIYEHDALVIEQTGAAILKAGIVARGFATAVDFIVTRTPINLGGGSWQIKAAGQMTPLLYVAEADGTAQLVSASAPGG